MVKKAKIGEETLDVPLGPRPRLVKMIIKNFRCIGSTPVEIDLDDIVVLVGPNNVGKSSVLKAYEVIMSEGSTAGQLALDDFPASTINTDALPEIELHTIVYDNSPGPEWVQTTASGEKLVRELWRWLAPGAPVRRGYNVEKARWASDEDKEKMPWGAAGVANARRPQPHRVDAFASPDTQAGEIIKLLMTAITDRVKAHQTDSKTNSESDFASLLSSIAALQKKIVAESKEQIDTIQKELSDNICTCFLGTALSLTRSPKMILIRLSISSSPIPNY
ncbi:AAA ATPase domain-containing protein [Syntrophus gentianae]|uniref:AAA ATPase domain-containing protein n=1 Tax=Syntrophus gentianae TaxID=43775 RepID=A0A1H8AJF4_9BACT|nr:AAA family ATPase [Syntrophus gentianae]SEM70895.1 AAA ATPase domain-containing protein [Syntrophus gentianae]